MTVAELILKLQKLPNQNLEVYTRIGLNHGLSSVTRISDWLATKPILSHHNCDMLFQESSYKHADSIEVIIID